MDIPTTREGGVLTIELNRPQKKNVITADMCDSLAAALIEAREAPAIRAVMPGDCSTGRVRGRSEFHLTLPAAAILVPRGPRQTAASIP
jgi:1,4-dihydroxy-2-naphthoyl-CoA synthase